jgi:transcriptional regulator with XRE-family HTH domain
MVNTNRKKSYYSDSGLGARIKLAIESCGFTQKKLAELTGLSPNSIVDYIKEKHQPSAQAIIDIAERCFVDSGWLLSGKKNEALGKNIGRIRIKVGIDPSVIAKKLGVPIEFISMVEMAELFPSDSWINRLCIEFHIFKSSLLRGDFPLIAPPGYDAVVVESEQTINLGTVKEIVNLLYEDPGAQEDILELLRARKKQREITSRLKK